MRTALTSGVAWALVAAASGSRCTGGCGPIPNTSDADGDTGGETTLDAGTLTDGDVALDWRVYGAWESGACLDLKFTNLGARITSWQFGLTFDRVVDEVAYPGPFPSSFTVTLDDARLVPFSEPVVQPFGTISYAVCLQPVVRPVAFSAQVSREGDQQEETTDLEDLQVYGYTEDDTHTLILVWLDKQVSPGSFCLELRLGNLTTSALTDWTVRASFDKPFRITETDTTFYYFQSGLDQLDLSAANPSISFDPLDIHVGSICMDEFAVPESIQATFRVVPPPVTP